MLTQLYCKCSEISCFSESMAVNNKASRDVQNNNKTSGGVNLIDSFNETDVSMYFEEEIIDESNFSHLTLLNTAFSL